MKALTGTPLRTLGNVEAVVARVGFRGWKFVVGDLGDGFYIQPRFFAPDTETGINATQTGRKWYVSPFATEEEVVKTWWLATEVACRHEAMEDFKLDGVSIFHPHTSTDSLVEMQRTSPLVHRPDKETNPSTEKAIAMAHDWQGPVPSGIASGYPEPTVSFSVAVDRLGIDPNDEYTNSSLHYVIDKLVLTGYIRAYRLKGQHARYGADSIIAACKRREEWMLEVGKHLRRKKS